MAKLTFFGTGTSQGIPMIGCNCAVCKSIDSKDSRLRSSVLIESKGIKLLIDAGPDFRYQMLRSYTSHLDALLLTHSHKDHTGGIDDIRSLNYFSKQPLPIYCESYVETSLKLEYHYVFTEDRYPGIPEIDIKSINNKAFNVYSLKDPNIFTEVTPIRAYHHKMPILGFRVDNIAYITDANYIPAEEFRKLRGLDKFVINTVRRERHISHFSLEEALKVIQEVGAKESYLTHLSHQIGKHSDLQQQLPQNVYVAYDNLII